MLVPDKFEPVMAPVTESVPVVVVVASDVVPVTATVPVVVRSPPMKVFPETVNFDDGVVLPIPTLPPSTTVKTSVRPSNKLNILPVPF